MNDNLSFNSVGWRPFVGIMIVGFALNLLQLTGPLFMMQVYDRVISSGSVPTLIGIAVIAAIAYIFTGLLDMLRTRAASRAATVIDWHLSPRCYHLNFSLEKLGVDGRINPIADLDRIRQFLSGPGLIAIFDMPWIPINLFFVYLLHPLLALVTTIGSLVLTFIMVLNGWLTTRGLAVLTELSEQRNIASEVARRNSEAIAGMGMQRAMTGRWDELAARYLKVNGDVSDLSAAFASYAKVGRMALQSGILGLGAYLVIKGEMSAGGIIASSILSSRALAPVDMAVGQWRNFVNARMSYRRLRNAFKSFDEREIETELPEPFRDLNVQHLATGPIGKRQVLVREITFDMEAGEVLAIVGPSGSGKSTIGKALTGVWPAYAGAVRLDKIQLDHWSPEQRGSFIGYMPQGVQLMPGTIAQNIARFLPDATSQQVIAAARLANAHDLIVSLPDGYDTRIEEIGGSGLSGGQMQRIGLARAFFGDPFLIVLDEPNSNLDLVGEKALIDAIMTARRRGAIVVVITHRANILSAVDKILVIQNGVMQRFGPASEVVPHITGGAKPAEQIATKGADSKDESDPNQPEETEDA